MLKKEVGKNKKGFTLIEALIFLFIFSIITMSFYRTYSIGLKYIIDSKNRLGALSVANEKMEIIRNLKYDSVGTVNGMVSGNIPDEEDVTENSSLFHVSTTVEYVQDQLDGVYPADTIPEDYKKVTVRVSWNSGQKDVSLVSRFVPTGLEVANPGDGILLVNVFSDQPGGSGISGSSVHVVNNETNLNTTVETDGSGSVTLMGDKIKDSIQNYQITLSKSGYETISTMPPYPTTPYNPVDVHASVVTGSINVANIVQNKPAALKIATVNYLNSAIENIGFHISGGRIVGHTVPTETDPTSMPVYNLDMDSTTDSSGEKDFGSVSPGQYVFSLAPSVTDYVLIDTDPILPIALFSEDNLTFKVKLADKDFTSLLVKVVANSEGNPPLEGAQVRLSNGSGYDLTQETFAAGTVFFPDTAEAFEPGVYDLKVTADGFSESNTQITIDPDQLKTETVTMTAL